MQEQRTARSGEHIRPRIFIQRVRGDSLRRAERIRGSWPDIKKPVGVHSGHSAVGLGLRAVTATLHDLAHVRETAHTLGNVRLGHPAAGVHLELVERVGDVGGRVVCAAADDDVVVRVRLHGVEEGLRSDLGYHARGELDVFGGQGRDAGSAAGDAAVF
jgi:hypothetical protein